MNPFICVTCGAHFSEAEIPPASCPICEDERQYVGHNGQVWSTLDALRQDHSNAITLVEPGLTGIMTEPKVAIGQQAHLIQTPAGNLLWNCVSLVDDATVEAIEQLGGLAAIAVSHPHFFTGVAAWSHAFGDAPVYLHADDSAWITHPDPAIHLWDGDDARSAPGQRPFGNPLWRALSGKLRPALARGSGGTWRAADRRHDHGRS